MILLRILEKLKIMKTTQVGYIFRNYQKKKAAIVIKELEIMFNSPTIYSKPVAKLEKGRLVKVIKCETKWCKVRSDKYKGWIKNKNLWGLF